MVRAGACEGLGTAGQDRASKGGGWCSVLSLHRLRVVLIFHPRSLVWCCCPSRTGLALLLPVSLGFLLPPLGGVAFLKNNKLHQIQVK